MNETLEGENLKLQNYIEDLQDKLKEMDHLKNLVEDFNGKMGTLFDQGIVGKDGIILNKN